MEEEKRVLMVLVVGGQDNGFFRVNNETDRLGKGWNHFSQNHCNSTGKSSFKNLALRPYREVALKIHVTILRFAKRSAVPWTTRTTNPSVTGLRRNNS